MPEQSWKVFTEIQKYPAPTKIKFTPWIPTKTYQAGKEAGGAYEPDGKKTQTITTDLEMTPVTESIDKDVKQL
jgi:hypothetical protein